MKKIKFIGTEGETEVPGIGLFKKNEIRELSDELANKLLSNVNFIEIKEERKPRTFARELKKVEVKEIVKEPEKEEKKEEDFRW